jgi:hypothetical protein
VKLYHSIRCHIPDNCIRHNHHCESFRSNKRQGDYLTGLLNGKDLEANIRDIILDTILFFSWRDWGNPRKYFTHDRSPNRNSNPGSSYYEAVTCRSCLVVGLWKDWDVNLHRYNKCTANVSKVQVLLLLLFLVGWDWVHLVLRQLPALDNRWWWLWSIWWNEDFQGKPKYSEKTCPSATLSTTNLTWPDQGSNPGDRGWKPATNRLSYGKAERFSWLLTRGWHGYANLRNETHDV